MNATIKVQYNDIYIFTYGVEVHETEMENKNTQVKEKNKIVLYCSA